MKHCITALIIFLSINSKAQTLPKKLKSIVPFTIKIDGKDEEFELYKIYEGKLDKNKITDYAVVLKRKYKFYEHYKMVLLIINNKLAFKNELVLCPFYYFDYGNDGLVDIKLNNNKVTTCEYVYDPSDYKSMYLYNEFTLKNDSLVLTNFYSSKENGSEKINKFEFESIQFNDYIHFMMKR